MVDLDQKLKQSKNWSSAQKLTAMENVRKKRTFEKMETRFYTYKLASSIIDDLASSSQSSCDYDDSKN